jgi:hypothetical protein
VDIKSGYICQHVQKIQYLQERLAKMKITDATRADIWFTFDNEEERDNCSHQGDCCDDCADMVDNNLVEFETIPRESAILSLEVTGGWTREELEEMDNRELYIKMVWVSAGNAKDENSLEASISTY